MAIRIIIQMEFILSAFIRVLHAGAELLSVNKLTEITEGFHAMQQENGEVIRVLNAH